MKSCSRIRPAITVAALALWAGAASPPAAMAVVNAYVPDTGGLWSSPGNWSQGSCPTIGQEVEIIVSANAHKTVTYDWPGEPSFEYVMIDGNAGGFYGALNHLFSDTILLTDDMYLGENGPGWNWMEGNALLWVLNNLYVGYDDPGEGHFYMAGDENVTIVSDFCYVGHSGEGDFDHVRGHAQIGDLYIGHNAPGTYWLKGPVDITTLGVTYNTVIGNADVGVFQQTGGTLVQEELCCGIILGLNADGEGTYDMRGGEVHVNRISIAYNGEGSFEQSGGTVTTINDAVVGASGSHTGTAAFTLNEDNGTAELHVGDDLRIGAFSRGTYDQDAGTAIVDDEIEIGADGELFLGGGTLDSSSVINGGIMAMTGGQFDTYDLACDTDLGINLSEGDFHVRYLTNTRGFVQIWDGAMLRGPSAGGGLYYLCEFENFDSFAMGDDTFDGGIFRGILTNHGSFDYWHGDFSNSILINYGFFNQFGPFTCRRLVSYHDMTVSPGRAITADGSGYTYAIENYANMTVQPGSPITLTGDKPMLNEGALFAGAPISQTTSITGDLVNKGVLALSHNANTGNLALNGDYFATTAAELQVRIGGTAWASEHDRLTIQDDATLAGELKVSLVNGFVPAVGDRFGIIRFAQRTGDFHPVTLPDLPAGRGWRMNYWAGGLTLVVAQPGDFEGDGDIDLNDYAQFADCMAGPDEGPRPSQSTRRDCLLAFDFDADDDVDMSDAAEFQMAFTGE